MDTTDIYEEKESNLNGCKSLLIGYLAEKK